MFLKKLFYASASILMLALAYHLGASTATAQAGLPGSQFSASASDFYVMTPNGDIYYNSPGGMAYGTPAVNRGNFWNGAPVPTTQPTFGALKAKYR